MGSTRNYSIKRVLTPDDEDSLYTVLRVGGLGKIIYEVLTLAH